MRLLALSLTALIILSGVILLIVDKSVETGSSGDLTVASVMAGDGSGFRKADSVVDISFPRDHFAHPEFRTEWWYFTGNLSSADGKRFGYQVTIFRNGIYPLKNEDTTGISASAVYSAHIGVSDLSTGEFHSFESFARGSEGLGGSDPVNSVVYAGSVSLKYDFGADPSRPKMTVLAIKNNIKLELELHPQKGPVLQGDKGLSRKSNKEGNAYYYYSFTRLKTDAVFSVNGVQKQLTGYSWMDREWSTSALDEDQKGWDWFALHLDDQTELMYLRLRDREGNTNFQKGSFVSKDGSYTVLKGDDLKLTTLSFTNVDGIKYPSEWSIEVLPLSARYSIKTAMKDQEHKFSIRYYEGAVDAEKTEKGAKIPGKGYVELTGYAD